MVLTVPKVKVIVVVGQCEEVAGPAVLIQFHESFRVPSLGFPLAYPVFKAEILLRIAGLFAEGIGIRALLIHSAGKPIAVFGLALGAPMCPDAELCIAEPSRAFIVGKRLPCGLVLSFLNGFARCIDPHGDGLFGLLRTVVAVLCRQCEW